MLQQQIEQLHWHNAQFIFWPIFVRFRILKKSSYLKQVGTPTLPTAIPLKSSSSMRATLVFNLFLNETMLVFNL
jgi:hypothetical protein